MWFHDTLHGPEIALFATVETEATWRIPVLLQYTPYKNSDDEFHYEGQHQCSPPNLEHAN